MATALSAKDAAARRVVRDFVCAGCGCACDDLTLTIEGDRIASLEPPCPVAEQFLLAPRSDAVPISVPDAIEQAAALLSAARAPLIMGFERATVDVQRLAVEIADRLGATIDPTDERGTSRSHAAVQTVGAVTATLGEVAQRSDLVVYWDCDPATTHPRHMERFASRAGVRTIVVSSAPTPSSALANKYLLIPTGSGVECLWTLRALVRGVALDAEEVEVRTGNSLDAWQTLAEQLKSATYGAVFYDAASADATASSQAITKLARDLHRHTRAVALPLGAAPSAVGAAQVLTWQTGFPAAVSFARGYPQYLPGEAMAVQLAQRKEVDAALIIAADPLAAWPKAAADYLRSLPTIVLDDRDTLTLQAATIGIRTAPFGLATTGDVFRADGVTLPLRAAVNSPLPQVDAVLARLATRLSG
jgi:formylmethanofuran dehydrogenase subunit B